MPSFLDLSTELRFRIYSCFTLPHESSPILFSGFYLSCHQIKAEIDQESAKAFKKLIEGIKDAKIEVPRNFLAMKDIRVGLDVQFYHKENIEASFINLYKPSNSKIRVTEPLAEFLTSLGALLELSFDSILLTDGDFGDKWPDAYIPHHAKLTAYHNVVRELLISSTADSFRAKRILLQITDKDCPKVQCFRGWKEKIQLEARCRVAWELVGEGSEKNLYLIIAPCGSEDDLSSSMGGQVVHQCPIADDMPHSGFAHWKPGAELPPNVIDHPRWVYDRESPFSIDSYASQS